MLLAVRLVKVDSRVPFDPSIVSVSLLVSQIVSSAYCLSVLMSLSSRL